MPTLKTLRAWLPALVIGIAFLWSSLYILARHREQSPPGTVTIRIGHWQLEAGVRDGFNQLAREYQRIHPNVRVVQDAIPEATYGQWMTTQLMGGTAPDLMEIGMLPDSILIGYQARYFVPLSFLAGRPNPYNKGSALERTPFRQTFKDGMRSGYVPELQQYMRIGLAQFGERIFYNKTLLKQLTGRDRAPTEYREFLATCGEIKRHKTADGKWYVPIASSKYHLWMWEMLMADILTYPALAKMDFNRDGNVDQFEHYIAFKTGRMTFEHPAYRARFKMFREIADNFQPGWSGLSRDEALFQFAQQRAVFISTGSWDARSLQAQAEGRFEVGVLDYPRPKPEDPEYGQFVSGPAYEMPWTGFPFGLARTSKHPDIALDFLLFLSSQKVNERFNRIIGWVPAIVRTQMDPMLQAFDPHLEGVYGVMFFFVGGNTQVRWTQDYSLFQIGQISYEDLAKRFGPYYREQGLKDYEEVQRDWRRTILIDESFLSGIRGKALLLRGQAAQQQWIKYRALTASRLILPEVSHARQVQMVKGQTDLGSVGPYEYSPEVLKRIQARLGGA